jgi:hypothetical protein
MIDWNNVQLYNEYSKVLVLILVAFVEFVIDDEYDSDLDWNELELDDLLLEKEDGFVFLYDDDV